MSLRYRELERLVRGFSNHRRIQVLETLVECPELSVSELSKKLKVEYKTLAVHVSRLAQAGLVLKRNAGNDVRHKISARGVSVLKFLRTLE